MTAIANWKQDPEIERRLEELGMKWEFKRNVHMSRIDREQSRENNARFGEAINQDACLEYAGFMEDGAIFPAPVIIPAELYDKGLKKGSYIVLAGNNRLVAVEIIDGTSIDAYIVTEATNDSIEMFVRSDNMDGKWTLSDDEKMQNIIDLHEKQGYKLIDLCRKFFGKRADAVYRRALVILRERSVRKELLAAGFDTKHLDKRDDRESVYDELHKLASISSKMGNVKVLRSAALATHDGKLALGQVKNMVKEVKRKKTEKDQLEVITAVNKENSKRIPKATRGTGPGVLAKSFSTTCRQVTALHTSLTKGNHGNVYTDFSQFGDPDEEKINKFLVKLLDIQAVFKNLKKGHKIRRSPNAGK